MARLRIEINGRRGHVAFPTFAQATNSFLSLLTEIGNAVPDSHEGRITWYVDDLSANGSLAVELHSKVERRRKRQRHNPPDFAPLVASSLIQGFENIEMYGTSPPFVSQGGLERINRMLNILKNNGANGFTAAIPATDRRVKVGKKALHNIEKLLPERRTEPGSIEGRLETVTIHKGSKFIVYDALTNKGVTCYIDSEKIAVCDATEALGKKVAVSGVVAFNERGEPISVRAKTLRVFPADSDLPTARSLMGSEPDFTGDLSTEEFLRSIRCG